MTTPYEDIFGVPADLDADKIQDRKHAVAVAKQEQAADLRLQAAINLRYAAEIDRVGRSPYMAEVHRSCADRKLAQAERIFPS